MKTQHYVASGLIFIGSFLCIKGLSGLNPVDEQEKKNKGEAGIGLGLLMMGGAIFFFEQLEK